MAHENPPSATNAERAESNSAGDLRLASHFISGEDRHAAFCAGYEQGRAERFEFEVEDFARALLNQRARQMLGFARQLATAKGPAWEAMIVWSGEADE
jgi:hypothetical protein